METIYEHNGENSSIHALSSVYAPTKYMFHPKHEFSFNYIHLYFAWCG